MKKLHLLTTLLLSSAFFLHAESIDTIAANEVADNEAVQIYGGTVGNLPAVFFIEWAGAQVFGHYYHPSKGKEKSYQLKGTNPKQGVLVLKEFTRLADGSNKLTATINLRKKIVGKKIIWSGTMNNTDGRKIPVSFSRKKM